MVASGLLLFALGLGIGTLGTLVGAGGGFILMPVFFFVYPHESPDRLTAISLSVVFFNALSGTISYGKKKRIDYRSGFFFSLASVPGAILGSYLTRYFSRDAFEPVFAALLGIAGTYLFLRPSKK